MMDGDSLLVDSVIPFYENRLTVTGAVWRPGEYELNGTVHTVRQLVDQAAGLKGDEFAGRAQITRLNPDFTTTVVVKSGFKRVIWARPVNSSPFKPAA